MMLSVVCCCLLAAGLTLKDGEVVEHTNEERERERRRRRSPGVPTPQMRRGEKDKCFQREGGR